MMQFLSFLCNMLVLQTLHLIQIRKHLILYFLTISIMRLNWFNTIKQKDMIHLKSNKLSMVTKSIGLLILILTIHLLNNWLTPSSEGVHYAWLPALIGAAASLVGGLFNRNSQEKYNDRMIRLQQETNDLNYKINQENNAYNRQLAIDMFNMENEYNNPAAQMTRLSNAGINPYVAAGNVGQVEGRVDTVAAQNPIPMSGPSGLGTQSPQLDYAQPFGQIASALASLAQASKTKTENKQLIAMGADILRQKKAEADLADATARQAEMDKIIKWLYGFDKARYEVDNLKETYNKLVNESHNIQADTLLKQMEKDWTEIRKKVDKRHLEQLDALAPYFQTIAQLEVENKRKQGVVLDTQAEENRAQTVSLFANAAQSKAATEQIEKLTPLLVKAQKYENLGKSVRNVKDMADTFHDIYTLGSRISSTMLNNSIIRVAFDESLQRLKQATIDNDYRAMQHEAEIILKFTQSIKNTTSAGKDVMDIIF